MKIILTNSASLVFGGGFEQFLLGLARHAANDGHEVVVLEPTNRMTKAISLATTLHVPQIGLEDSVIRDALGDAEWTRAGLGESRALGRTADLIYCNNEPQDVLFARSIAGRNTKLVVGMHSATQGSGGRLAGLRKRAYGSHVYRRMLSQSFAIHLISPSQRTFVDRLGLPASVEIDVVQNGIDTNTFSAMKPASPYFTVLFAGRLIEQKGIDVFVDAANDVLARQEDVRFIIAGDGPLKSDVLRFADSNPQVEYMGYQANMAKIYQRADVLVAPSRWETFGLVPAEALSCGLPVVISNLEAFSHLSGEMISRVPGDDARETADAIMRLADLWSRDRAAFDALRSQARAFAMSVLDSDVKYDQLLELFARARAKTPVETAR